MSEHAPIAPSSLYLTVACAASVGLQALVAAQPETEDELEGTAAHWVAMRYAAGYAHELPVDAEFTSKGRKWKVDIDMKVGAVMYQNACGASLGGLRLEDPVKISRIHAEHCWGTPDAWQIVERYVFPPHVLANNPSLPTRPVKLVRVIEYKYGHRFVEVFENYQGAAYVSGVMERLRLDDNDPDLYFEITLVQPRTYHREGPVRVWRGPASHLRATLNVARSSAAEALGESSRFGEAARARTSEHCIDCRARHACVTLQTATHAYIDFSGSPELVEMPAEAMGQELAMVEDAIKRLKARQTGLAAQAETLLRQGKPVAFYHMESGESRLVYRDDVSIDEVVGLGDLIGISLRKPQTWKDVLVTPKQAMDLGIDEAVMKPYSYRPPAAQKLTRDNSITARKVFSK